jgi:hypothetical protein
MFFRVPGQMRIWPCDAVKSEYVLKLSSSSSNATSIHDVKVASKMLSAKCWACVSPRKSARLSTPHAINALRTVPGISAAAIVGLWSYGKAKAVSACVVNIRTTHVAMVA